MDDKSTAALLIGLVLIGVVLAIGLVLTVGGASAKVTKGMTLTAPATVYVSDEFKVKVTDELGNALPGAAVGYGGTEKLTDSSGEASFTATTANALSARKTGYPSQNAMIGSQMHKITLEAPAEVINGVPFAIRATDEAGKALSGVAVAKTGAGEAAKLTDSYGNAWFEAGLEEKSAADVYKGNKQYYNPDTVSVREKNSGTCSDYCSMKAYAISMSNGHKNGEVKPGKPTVPTIPQEPNKNKKVQKVDLNGNVVKETQFINAETGVAKNLHGVANLRDGYVVGIEDDNTLAFLDEELNVRKIVQLDESAREISTNENAVTVRTEVAVSHGNKVSVFDQDGALLAAYAADENLWSVAISDTFLVAMDSNYDIAAWARAPADMDQAADKSQQKQDEKKLNPIPVQPPGQIKACKTLPCHGGGGGGGGGTGKEGMCISDTQTCKECEIGWVGSKMCEQCLQPAPGKCAEGCHWCGTGGGVHKINLEKESPISKEQVVAATESWVIVMDIYTDPATGEIKTGTPATPTQPTTPEQPIKQDYVCRQHCAAANGLAEHGLPADHWGGKTCGGTKTEKCEQLQQP